MIIPSIDLLDGKVVVLKQGKIKAMELQETPLAIARKLACFPEVQVIDLNAAFGNGNNSEMVKELCAIINARVGGGIRAIKKAIELTDAGAAKIIIGTKANKEFLSELRREIEREKIVAAIDSFNGKIVVDGWRKKSRKTIEEKVAEVEPYCNEFLFSFAEKDGTMQGVNLERVKDLKSLTSNKITIAGGIATMQEIKSLEKIGVNAVVGMALYKGKIGGLL